MHKKFSIRRLIGMISAALMISGAGFVAIQAPAVAATDLGYNSTVDYSGTFAGGAYLSTTTTADSANSAFDVGATFAVEAWIKPNSSQSSTCITSTTDGSLCIILWRNRSYSISILDGYWSYAIQVAGAGWQWISTGQRAYASRWQHVALVGTGSAVKFYFDGQQVYNLDGAKDPDDNTAPLEVGTTYYWLSSTVANYRFQGEIDEIKIWNGSNRASYLESDMHSYGSGNGTTFDSALKHYYDFNEGYSSSTSGNTIFDRVGTNHLTARTTSTDYPTSTDLKTTTKDAGKTIVAFTRSYLTPGGGWTVPSDATKANALVVAGGGGGASRHAGGGGAGEVGSYSLLTLTPSATMRIKVGLGGLGHNSETNNGNNSGGSGQSAILGSDEFLGGGGGQGGTGTVRNGGSGGGTAGSSTSGGSGINGTGVTSSPTLTRYVAAGASGSNNGGTAWFGGGGGGATGSGGAGSNVSAGSGGQGFSSNITGAPVCYAAGGGGGASNSANGAAGTCTNGATTTAGAGSTSSAGNLANHASVNSGSGGGGGGLNSSDDQPGGNGGSGIIVIAYATQVEDTAFDFPGGVEAQLRAANKQIIPNQASFTFETWFKADTLGNGSAWDDMFRQQATDSNYKAFGLGVYNGQLQFVHSVQDSDAGTLNTVATSVPYLQISTNKWYHVALATTKSGNAYNWKVYVDGIFAKEYNFTATSLSTLGSAQVSIGNLYSGTSTRAWDGQIDQIKVWNGALTNAEILRSMHTYAAESVVDSSGSTLRAHFDFNSSATTVLKDQTGNGYDFALKSGATAPTVYQVASTATVGTDTRYRFEKTYLTTWGGWVPSSSISGASVLAVAGGGGGGSPHGGGGGAGGLASATNISLSGVVPVKVGQGGFGQSQSSVGTCSTLKVNYPGQSTTIGSITVPGGGAGAMGCNNSGGNQSTNTQGGSGGGAAYVSTDGANYRGASNIPSSSGTITYYGNIGSYGSYNAATDDQFLGGGGGGAGSAAVNGTSASAGIGGSGFKSNISGSDVCYAAGGGGGAGSAQSGTAGAGGTCSGMVTTAGAGSRGANRASDAVANTGSGGGGGGYLDSSSGDILGASGNGGSGVIIVSVKTANAITFNANTGTGSLATQYVNLGATANLTSRGTSIVKTGNDFMGWATTSNGSVAYADGASITPSGDVTLYAIWGNSLPKVNVAFDELDFDFSDVAHIVGTNGKSQGNKVLFRNVTTKGGVQVDALVTTETLSGVTIANYESGTGAGGANSYFQVDANFSANNGFAKFKFDFYKHDGADPCTTSNTSCTGATKVVLQNVNVSAIDIDYYQWNDLTGVESYTIASATKLNECTIPLSGTCTVRQASWSFPADVRAQGSADTARTNDPVDMIIANYGEIETFSIKFGRSLSGNTNYYGVAFKALSWGVQTPSTVGGTSYTIAYNANGASVGNVPSSNTGAVGTNVTLPGANTLTKAGHTFGGWMTAADGSGTTYAAGSVIQMPSGGMTLYAKWNAVQYMLIYKLYGGVNGPATEMRYTGAVANLSSVVPIRDGVVFDSWNTAADGSGTTYASGASFTMPGANTTLHAMWSVATGTVAYNGNNSTSGSIASVTGTSGTSHTVSGVGNLVRTNYTFAGWNTAANGSGTDYVAGSSINYPANATTTTLYAQWTPVLYSLSYNANGGSGTPTGTSVTAGTSVSIGSTLPTRTGYSFAGWTTAADGSGTVYSNGGANAAITMPGSNTVLYAKWTAITYTLTYNSNDAGAGSAPSAVSGKTYGETFAVAAAPTAPTGFKFNGWNTAQLGSGSTYSVGGTYQITADATLYAQWVVDSVNLFFSANGGNGAPTSTTANANTNTTLPSGVPARTGFTFAGWTSAQNGSGTVYGAGATFPVPGNDVTLYAKWTAISYLFSYDANGGSGAPSAQGYYMGEFVTIDAAAPTRTGYSFTGWNTAANGSGADYQAGQAYLMTNSNMTMYAKWTSNPYTLTYNTNGGTGAPAAETRLAGSSANLSSAAPTRDGYTFNGWNTAQNGSGQNYNSSASFTMATSNATLYAQWTAVSNTVSYNANTGSGAPGGATYTFGATVTVSNSSPTKTGHTFLGWNTAANGSGTNYSAADTFSMPSSSVTLYAKWSTNQQIFTYDANGGTGAAAPVTYAYGATVTISATAPTRSGYTFVSWNSMADGTGTIFAAGNTFTMPANDLTVYAIWSVNAYTVYYNMNGGIGSVAAQPAMYGSSVTVSSTVPTRIGYSFSGWHTTALGTGGSDYTGGGSLVMPASNVTLYAKWTAITYSISYNANSGGGAPSDATGLTYGQSATLSSTAPTYNGYVFNGWNTAANGSGQTYAGGQAYIVPAANTTLYAQWVANTYEVIYNANGGTGAPAAENATTSANINLSSTQPTRAGYTFVRWNTDITDDPNASPLNRYAPGGAFTVPAGNTVLYAIWALSDITVTYDVNGGTGSAPASVTDKFRETISLAPSTSFSKSGNTFNGWNTSADGTGQTYAAESDFVLPSTSLTLYAQWSPTYFAIEYNAAGGTGEPADQFAAPGQTVTVANTEPTKSGYEFDSWTSAGSGSSVNPGGTLTMPSTNVVLVASWVTRANVSGGNQSNPSTSPSPSQSTTPAPKKLTETVYFSGDSAKLLPKTKALLKSLATKAKKFGVVTKIDVIGRVKETADKSYDMRLSRQRATNVANYLKKLGVKGTFLIKAAGISPENKPISRRVNIFLFWNK